MVLLDSTLKSLEVVLAGAITTNQLVYVAGYADLTAIGTTLGETDGLTNSTTAVTAVAAPAASTVRKVTFLNIYNLDTVSATVTVRVNNNGTFRTLAKVTLATGYTLVMNNEGWKVIGTDGAVQQSGSSGVSTHNILDSTVHTDALTGTVVRGDVIVGNSTPKWSRKAVGTGVLAADGTDVTGWTQNPTLATPVVNTLLDLTGGQIKFPATQVASGNANTIDDAERGLWVPVLGGDGGATSGQTYGVQVGEYVKLGQFVVATARIELTAKGTISGNVRMEGLPFTLGNTAGLYVSGVVTYFANFATNWMSVACFGATGQSAALLIGRKTAGTSVEFFATADITNTTAVAMCICYRTSA